jgi:hypothetical protein
MKTTIFIFILFIIIKGHLAALFFANLYLTKNYVFAAAAALAISSSVTLESPTSSYYELNAREQIFIGRNALIEISRQISPSSDVSLLLRNINFVRNTFQLDFLSSHICYLRIFFIFYDFYKNRKNIVKNTLL